MSMRARVCACRCSAGNLGVARCASAVWREVQGQGGQGCAGVQEKGPCARLDQGNVAWFDRRTNAQMIRTQMVPIMWVASCSGRGGMSCSQARPHTARAHLWRWTARAGACPPGSSAAPCCRSSPSPASRAPPPGRPCAAEQRRKRDTIP